MTTNTGASMRTAPTTAVVPTKTRMQVPHTSARYVCHCFTSLTSRASDQERFSNRTLVLTGLDESSLKRRRESMADRDCERIGGVVRRRHGVETEDRAHHLP